MIEAILLNVYALLLNDNDDHRKVLYIVKKIDKLCAYSPPSHKILFYKKLLNLTASAVTLLMLHCDSITMYLNFFLNRAKVITPDVLE